MFELSGLLFFIVFISSFSLSAPAKRTSPNYLAPLMEFPNQAKVIHDLVEHTHCSEEQKQKVAFFFYYVHRLNRLLRDFVIKKDSSIFNNRHAPLMNKCLNIHAYSEYLKLLGVSQDLKKKPFAEIFDIETATSNEVLEEFNKITAAVYEKVQNYEQYHSEENLSDLLKQFIIHDFFKKICDYLKSELCLQECDNNILNKALLIVADGNKMFLEKTQASFEINFDKNDFRERFNDRAELTCYRQVFELFGDLMHRFIIFKTLKKAYYCHKKSLEI